MASVQYEDGFIIGGPKRAKLTPNFSLGEFASRGIVPVHQELVGALQRLRTAQGGPIKILRAPASGGPGPAKAGLFAFVQADDQERLVSGARALVKEGVLAKAGVRGGRLCVEVHRPGEAPPVSARPAFGHALTVTATFETGGLAPFETVTGNFDGAGMSFGPIQSNFTSGTLQDLFREFIATDKRRVRACFGDGDDYAELLRVLGSSRAKQIAWADSKSIGARKAKVAQPWRGYFQAVGREPKFQAIMVAQAYNHYGRAVIKALNWLAGVSSIPVRNFSCLAALFDLCVQQGSLDRAHKQIRARVAEEQPKDEHELVRIAVTERGRRANQRWRADCVSRRLSILERRPVTVRESGRIATRRNLNLYLLRDTKVRGLESYLVGNPGRREVG
jgi:hypothetical protein